MRFTHSCYAVLASVVLAACGGGTSTDAGTDTPPPMDALDAADVTIDTGLDAADVVGDTSDAGTVSFIGMVPVMQLSGACMPSVPPDPLTFMGSVTIQNTGTLPIGLVMATDGAIVMGTTVLATFSIMPVTIPTVAPGMMGSANTSNVVGTVMPSNICTSPPCGSTVRVRIAISGNNVPAGAYVYSELVPMMCTF